MVRHEVSKVVSGQYECAWMLLNHLDRILEIDPSWTRDEYLETLRKRNIVGRVVLSPMGQVLGFRIERFPKRHEYNLVHIAVDPECQRQGLGTLLIEDFVRKARGSGRKVITTIVPERNMGALKFLKSCKFLATEVLRRHFGQEDGIFMKLEVKDEGDEN